MEAEQNTKLTAQDIRRSKLEQTAVAAASAIAAEKRARMEKTERLRAAREAAEASASA